MQSSNDCLCRFYNRDEHKEHFEELGAAIAEERLYEWDADHAECEAGCEDEREIDE